MEDFTLHLADLMLQKHLLIFKFNPPKKGMS